MGIRISLSLFYFTLFTVFLTLSLPGCSQDDVKRDVLYQTSTIHALLEGVYDGDMTFRALKQYGDFGLGTLNALDGELIGIEGRLYQIKSDGSVYSPDDSMKTPFAVITFFEPDKTLTFHESLSLEQLENHLDGILPSKNIVYAIRVDGMFRYVKTRSVLKQEKPYPRLIDAVKNQPVFEFYNIRGTIAAFWLPQYVEGINIPGYHFHFITEDRKSGGHVLAMEAENIKVQIDYTSEIHMVLPQSEEFFSVDLTNRKQKELEKVER